MADVVKQVSQVQNDHGTYHKGLAFAAAVTSIKLYLLHACTLFACTMQTDSRGSHGGLSTKHESC